MGHEEEMVMGKTDEKEKKKYSGVKDEYMEQEMEGGKKDQ